MKLLDLLWCNPFDFHDRPPCLFTFLCDLDFNIVSRDPNGKALHSLSCRWGLASRPSYLSSFPNGVSAKHRLTGTTAELLAVCGTSGALRPVEIDFIGRTHENSGSNQT